MARVEYLEEKSIKSLFLNFKFLIFKKLMDSKA